MELVWEQYFAKHLQMTVSGFYYPIRRLIGEKLDPGTGNFVFTNAGSLNLRGLALELKRKMTGGLEGTASYSFQDASNSNASMPLTNSPKHLFQAGLIVPLVTQKVFASVNLQYVSKRASLTGQTSAAYLIPNLTLFSRNLLNGWEFSASLYNMFNHRYADPAGGGLAENLILQDGRNFRVKVGYRFR
jgi:iron complex outermembrane receptor protein